MSATANAWLFTILTMAIVGGFSASLVWAGGRDGHSGRWQPLLLVLVVPLAVGLLYALRGEPAALSAPPAAAHANTNSLDAAAQKLSERLEREPADLEGWLMLARTRGALGQYAEAAVAYERAATRIVDDPALLVEWIEMRVLAADQHVDARTAELLDRASRLAPDDPEVLSLQALAALDRGDAEAASAALHALDKQLEPGSQQREEIARALDQIARGEDPRGGPLRGAAR